MYTCLLVALVTVIICSCIHGCFHASLFVSLLVLQAECEALRAEAVKWEGDAKSLSSMQIVSTMNIICAVLSSLLLYLNYVVQYYCSITCMHALILVSSACICTCLSLYIVMLRT